MMLVSLRKACQQFCSELGQKNSRFIKQVSAHRKKFSLHEQSLKAKKKLEGAAFAKGSTDEQLAGGMYKQAKTDETVRAFIAKFNQEHKGKINMLDMSHYTNSFGDLKDIPLRKQDMDILKEFQKRKVDLRKKELTLAHNVYKLPADDEFLLDDPAYNEKKSGMFDRAYNYTDTQEIEWVGNEEKHVVKGEASEDTNNFTFAAKVKVRNDDGPTDTAGPLQINSEFVMVLLTKNTTTKITTLNRINFFRVLVFMGNGNGIISHGKSRSLMPDQALVKAVEDCKKNLIAIPLDLRCTLPRAIDRRFQDYHLYVRPLPGFNSWGHPVMSILLSLSGFKHLGFKTIHTGKNMYTLLGSLFKVVTKNTTPKEMAEMEGYKVYRHRWVRPLTDEATHQTLSY